MFEKQLKLIAGFVWGKLKSATERKHRSNLLIRSNDSQWWLLSKYFWTEVLGDNPRSFANCQSMIFDTLYSAASCNYSVGVRSRWEFINWKDWKKFWNQIQCQRLNSNLIVATWRAIYFEVFYQHFGSTYGSGIRRCYLISSNKKLSFIKKQRCRIHVIICKLC